MVILDDVEMGKTQNDHKPNPNYILVLSIIHSLFQDNQSALHLASDGGHSGVVELLVESGARLDIQNKVY